MKLREFTAVGLNTRISHPEDLLWQRTNGYQLAIQSLKYISSNPVNITIKFDGSPALIFGREKDGKLVVTDKSGFSAKRYDGFAKSAIALNDMLFKRAPNVIGRQEYANSISALWPLFENIVPLDFVGYFQCDLMYVGQPAIVNEQYQIQPNKILYNIDANSALGHKVALSKAGIVVHGFIANKYAAVVPVTLNDIAMLQNQGDDLLVLSPFMDLSHAAKVANPIVKINTTLINNLLDSDTLHALKLTDFGSIIGKFIANQARVGNSDFDANAIFDIWLRNSNVSIPKQTRITMYIKSNMDAWNEFWTAFNVVLQYKTHIKHNLDAVAQTHVTAYMHDNLGHEGYVGTSPYGVIKLVDRHIFMQGRKNVIVFSGRFQPPHKGHVETWHKLRELFGPAADIFIASSNKVTANSPFTFAEKKALMIHAGIPADAIIETASPYRPHEITNMYDINDVTLIYVISSKDRNRFSFTDKVNGTLSYMQKWVAEPKSAKEHGYVITMPAIEYFVTGKTLTSASELRKMFATANTTSQKHMIQELYGSYSKKVHKILHHKLGK